VTAATCTQQDVDEYLTSGPTTRHSIRTFFIWAKKSKINKAVQIGHRQAKSTRTLTQDQRLAWLKSYSPATLNHCSTGCRHTVATLRPTAGQNRAPTDNRRPSDPARDTHNPWG
jgi:hypothetical protein